MNLLLACPSYNISFLYVTSGLTKINSNYTKSYNFSDSYIERVCAEIQDPYLVTYNLVDTTLPFSSMINLALLLVIVILSIFGARKEEYKWLVLNWSVLNFTMVFYFGVHMVYPKIAYLLALSPTGSFGHYVANFFMLYLNRLCNYTIFPIAFNRFLALYLPNHYDIIFKNKMFLFLSILGYDIVWLGIIALYNIFTNPWLGLIIGLMVSMVTMILALLILTKIYKLMKMIDKKSSQTSTYKNMQAAALMCLLEGFIGVLINLPSIYKNVFMLTSQEFNGSDIQIFSIKLYVIFALLNEFINYYAIIVDCVITLLVLRSYKKFLILLFIYPYKMYMKHVMKKPITSTNTLFVQRTIIDKH